MIRFSDNGYNIETMGRKILQENCLIAFLYKNKHWFGKDWTG